MENERTGVTAAQQSLALLKPDDVVRFLSNPRASGIRATDDVIESARPLGMVFDAILRLMQINRAKIELYYPTDTEILEEILARRRAVSDHSAAPSRSDMLRYLLMLAELQPPAVYLLRELSVSDKKLRFVTKIVAGDESLPHRLKNGMEHVIRNSLATIRSHLVNMDFSKPIQERIVSFKTLDDIPGILKQGRVDGVLSDVYIRKSELETPAEKDLVRVQKINHQMREIVLRPILLQLTKSREAIRMDLSAWRRDSGRQFGDPIFFNNPAVLRARAKQMSDLLLKEPVLKAMESMLPREYMSPPDAGDAEKRGLDIARRIIESSKNRSDVPDSLVELAGERLGLDQFLRDSERQEQVSMDREEMVRLLQTLKQHNGIFRAKQGNRIQVNERLLDYITRGLYSGILIGTEPPVATGAKIASARDYETIYFLLKDREATAKAVTQAEELFAKVEDVLLVRILEQMFGYHERTETELKEYIAPAFLDRFRTLVAQSYAINLPFFQKFWLSLKGLLPDSKAQRAMWEDYLASQSRKKGEPRKSRSEAKAAQKPAATGGPRQAELDDGTAAVLAKLVHSLEVMWQKGHIPNEKMLMSSLHTADDRAKGERILSFLRLGTASVRDIVEVKVPNQESVFASRPWIEKNAEALRDKYRRRLADFEGIETKKGIKLSLKNAAEKNLCQALLAAVNNIGLLE